MCTCRTILRHLPADILSEGLMKNNRIILLVVMVLGIVAFYLVTSQNSFTIKKELRDFAITDTGSVTKIFMADKTGKQVTLQKISPGIWQVNGKYEVRQDAIDLLLYTMMNLKVKNPVARSAQESVLKHMSTYATKTEIYINDRLAKVYYVGGATADQLGTFMLLENSSIPFVIYLESFNGYLTSRYFTDENLWRSKVLFNYEPGDLLSVSVQHNDTLSKSFKLTHYGQGAFRLNTYGSKEETALSDTLRAWDYFSLFGNIQVETIVTEIIPAKKDSVLKSKPIMELDIVLRDQTKRHVVFFPMPVSERSLNQTDDAGFPLKFDLDRMYALADDKEFVIVQHFVMDKLLVPSTFFTTRLNN